MSMNTEPRIETLASKKLVGKRLRMSLSDNKTPVLWASFMPHRKHIRHAIGNDLYNMQVYAPGFTVDALTPATSFEQWATMEVSAYEAVPEGMETYDLKGGLYAVFLYKGKPENFAPVFHYIHKVWFPQSAYEPDAREHFERLGEKYKRDDDASEEELWIPVRLKTKTT